MEHRKIICIDFGSSFTKVAVRKDWDISAQLIYGADESAEDVEFCIPSVVAKVKRSSGTRWLIEAAAAAQRPGDKVEVHRYWKADLFAPPRTSHRSRQDCEAIAVVFFQQLREMLSRHITGKLPVRICIPRLDGGSGASQMIEGILRRAGWLLAERATISEPESNACGVLSRGINQTWIPPRQRARLPELKQMFEKSFCPIFKPIYYHGRTYQVLVTDIGAFTTDFGLVRFNDSFFDPDAPRPTIAQKSYMVGVELLDNSLREILGGRAQQSLDQMNLVEWEEHKRSLYQGREIAVPKSGGGMFVLGSPDDRSAIDKAVRTFARKVLKDQEEFCTTRVKGKINAHVLTGGGMMIPGLRRELMNALSGNGTQLFDLLDPTPPEDFPLKKDPATGVWFVPPKELAAYQRQNQELVRGASAIGGCSVFFEKWGTVQDVMS